MTWPLLVELIFALSSFSLLLYSINIIYLSIVYLVNLHSVDNRKVTMRVNPHPVANLPVVTTQIPVFNEAGIIEETLLSLVDIDYPKGKHQIQVLDDSNDGTSVAIAKVVEELQRQGHWVQHVCRGHRSGYKAGALNNAMSQARGEFLLILDADFRPKPDVFHALLPFLLKDEKLAYVQARWGHRNYVHSLLTKVQALAIDGHFIVEQRAKNLLGVVSHFNGTAGLWRKSAVIDVGMWPTDVLSEDVAISYETYLRRWRSAHLTEYVIEGELPNRLTAYKIQQARWATGTIQVAKKYLPAIFRSDWKLGTKVQAFFHLTMYTVNIWVVLNIVSIGLILSAGSSTHSLAVPIGFTFLVLSLSGPLILYFCAYCVPRKRYVDFLVQIGPFLALSGGMALSNARAVLRGLSTKNIEFERTPKASHVHAVPESRKYPKGVIADVIWGVFCSYSAYLAIVNHSIFLAYFLASYTAGIMWMTIESVTEAEH